MVSLWSWVGIWGMVMSTGHLFFILLFMVLLSNVDVSRVSATVSDAELWKKPHWDMVEDFYYSPHYEYKTRPSTQKLWAASHGSTSCCWPQGLKLQVLPQEPGLANAGEIDLYNISTFNNFSDLPRMFILLGNYWGGCMPGNSSRWRPERRLGKISALNQWSLRDNPGVAWRSQ